MRVSPPFAPSAARSAVYHLRSPRVPREARCIEGPPCIIAAHCACLDTPPSAALGMNGAMGNARRAPAKKPLLREGQGLLFITASKCSYHPVRPECHAKRGEIGRAHV